jgi:hypothetical protein
MARRRTALLVAAALACTRAARAEDDAAVQRRLDEIEATLRDGEAAARAWQVGWGSAYWGLAVGQGALATAIDDRDRRAELWVGAAKSAVGAAAAFVLPWTAAHAGSDLAAMDATTPGARRRKLARADALLRAAADEETFERSWLSHAGVLLVNLGGGAVLWSAYDLRGPAILSVVSGVAVGEAQIWTAPTRARDAAPSLSVGATAGGVVLRGSF